MTAFDLSVADQVGAVSVTCLCLTVQISVSGDKAAEIRLTFRLQTAGNGRSSGRTWTPGPHALLPLPLPHQAHMLMEVGAGLLRLRVRLGCGMRGAAS